MFYAHHELCFAYVVGCRGVVQLGSSDPWYNQGGSAKVGSRKSIFNTWKQIVYLYLKYAFLGLI